MDSRPFSPTIRISGDKGRVNEKLGRVLRPHYRISAAITGRRVEIFRSIAHTPFPADGIVMLSAVTMSNGMCNYAAGAAQTALGAAEAFTRPKQ
jgi:hypothetical protein